MAPAHARLVGGVAWAEAALIVWALSHTPEYGSGLPFLRGRTEEPTVI